MMKTIPAIYENGSLKLTKKLPMRNHARVRIVFEWPTSVAKRTQGLLRVPPRLVHLVVDSDEFSLLNS